MSAPIIAVFVSLLAAALAAPHPALLEVGVCVGPRCASPVEQQVEALLALTKTQPEQACKGALRLLGSNVQVGPPTGDFAMPAPSIDILNTGIGELAAQGLLRSLEAETTPHSGPPAGVLCWTTIMMMGVSYNQERGLAFYEHSPSLWDAVIAWNKRVRHSAVLLRFSIMMIAGLFGTPPSDQCLRDLDEAGGFDFIFDVLEHNSSDLLLMQAAWAGLSDNVENRRVGAELVADKGGKGKGLEFLIGLLPAYRGRHAWPPFAQFGLRYESIHDINGILMHDDAERTWQKIAAKAGFMEEAIWAMKEEPEDHLTQENGCEAVALMGRGSPANLARLEELGAIELMVAAVATFKQTKPDGYFHLNSCSSGLVLFAQKAPMYQDKMLQLGLLDEMQASLHVSRDQSGRREPWLSSFPWSDVDELLQLLTTRRT